MEYTTKAGQMHRGSAIRWRKRVRKAVNKTSAPVAPYMFVLDALKRTCRSSGAARLYSRVPSVKPRWEIEVFIT